MTDSTQTTTSSQSEALATIEAIYAAWAANDADALAELYTDDATVVQPGVFKKSKDEIRSTMAAGFAGPLKGSYVLDTPQSVRFLGGDIALVIAEGGIVMAGAADGRPERAVRATWVLTKLDGRWMVAAYHNSPVSFPGVPDL
jgi:uncharacterized protein (TIGR02246 family)